MKSTVFDKNVQINILVIIVWTLVGIFLYLSNSWGLSRDSSLMHYVAGRILEGEIPYLSLIENNLPGTYAVHILCITLFGKSESGWHYFTVVIAFILSVSLTSTISGLSKQARLLLIAVGIIVFVAMSPNQAGQRDMLILMMLAMSGVALQYSERFVLKNDRVKHILCLLLSGLIAGYTIWIKPTATLGILLLLLYCAYLYRANIISIVCMLIGVIVPSICFIVFLSSSGGIDEFRRMCFEYFPLYTNLASISKIKLIGNVFYSFTFENTYFFGLLATLILLATQIAWLIYLYRNKKFDSYSLIYLLTLYCFTAYVAQGRGWRYHSAPYLYVSILMWIAISLEGWNVKSGLIRNSSITLTLILLCGVSGWAWRQVQRDWSTDNNAGFERNFSTWIEEKKQDSNLSIQVWDTSEGAYRVMYNKGLHNATPYMYDFMLLHDTSTAIIQHYRQGFMQSMKNTMPEYFVIINHPFYGGYGEKRLNLFNEFNAWLNKYYLQESKIDGYAGFVVYHKK